MLRGLQLLLQIQHVQVVVPVTLSLAQADTVDDACVVQLVRDHGIAVVQDCLKQTSVGIETGWVQNCIIGSVELGDGPLQLLVNIL